MLRIVPALACLLLGSSPLLFAADCSSLKNLPLPNTTITLAEEITSGAPDIPDAGAPLSGLPAFCRVAGELHPTADSRIRFEVWLPAQDWNGRILGTGNGGFAGAIDYPQLAGYLRRGFAVSGTDAGHQGESTDATWAYAHPEKIKDFGWRAIHLTAGTAQQITRAFYGKPARKSYFDACSDGGREALMEAQRFPEDYDGILAGAPANAWSTMLAGGAAAMQTLMSDPNAYIPDRKLAALQHASLAACDALDGVHDHVIGDPSQCRFDPQTLLCKPGDDSASCLTQPQIDSVQALYAGSKDSRGNRIFPGFTPGNESSWKLWIVGEDPGSALGDRFVENYFRYMVTGNPKANVLAMNLDDLLRQSRSTEAADLDATSPDLTRFAAHGGKLILYHGWNDPAISPYNTVHYFESVQQKMGADRVAAFARLYMVPGMEHCLGGPGATAFGQFGTPTAKGPQYGLFDSLVNWVENGAPDASVIATKYSAGKNGAMEAAFTRPLCPWPKVARYSGSGDPNDAASFACAAP
ncbi:MAG TPA: tannase/feruloyl esterase family alpha/beta hydrolase [Acidobacteriaceae bacterium]|nr:tannase/feruloyl esterase family alpha/beta hydrolase [Acidobacteriaceae bacterium]